MKKLIEAKKYYDEQKEDLKYRINFWMSERGIYNEFHISELNTIHIKIQGYIRKLTLEEIQDFEETFNVKHDTRHECYIEFRNSEGYYQHVHFFSYDIKSSKKKIKTKEN